MVQLKGLGPLKNPVTLSGIEPATFRLVMWCFNKVRYRVPQGYVWTQEFQQRFLNY
jgi:hypothetical protein